MHGERRGSVVGGSACAVLTTVVVGVGTMAGIVVVCGLGGVLFRVCRECMRAIVRVRCGAIGLVEVGVVMSPFEVGVCCWLGPRLSGLGLGCHGKVVGSKPGLFVGAV